MASSLEEVPPKSKRKIQEAYCGVDHRWAATYQTVAKGCWITEQERSVEGGMLKSTDRAEYRHRAHCDVSKR